MDFLLDAYVVASPGDLPILLYTDDCVEPAAWVSAGLAARAIPHRRMWMAPVTDPELVHRLQPLLPSPSARHGRLIVITLERETMSHSFELAQLMARYPPEKRALFRMIGASAALFRTALHVAPGELSALNAAVLDRCMPASRLRIRTRGGTDLEVTLDSGRHQWISNRGLSAPGGTVILPAGEVATFPAVIDGTHVADFAFNINAIVARDARLVRNPVTLRIEKSRVIEYRCDDRSIMRLLDKCLEDDCTRNIGELGFGTNPLIVSPVAMNTHINERRRGVHLGLGQHNQSSEVVPYRCELHLDLIARGGQIWFDDDPVPLDLEDVRPSTRPHPSQPRDEDVFSPHSATVSDGDCCGQPAALSGSPALASA